MSEVVEPAEFPSLQTFVDYERECWFCGTTDATPDIKGRLLCSRCRFRLAINELVLNGSRHGIEWYLTHCWRCDDAPVLQPELDPLGLCDPCIAALQAESIRATYATPKIVELPTALEPDRAVAVDCAQAGAPATAPPHRGAAR